MTATNPYASPSSTHWPRKRAFILASATATLALIVTTLMLLGPFQFGYFSVCSQCGCTRHTTEYQLPYMQITYWTTHDPPRPTRLSRSFIIQPHEHVWYFGAGGGNGIQCALGRGIELHRGAESFMYVSFLETIHRFEGDKAAKAWLQDAVDHRGYADIEIPLAFSGFPESGFSSKDEYLVWRSRAEKKWAKDFGNMPLPPP